MRLLMVGLDNAGKTTIVRKFNNESIDEIPPTLGFNITSLRHMGYFLNIWDVGGQKTIRSYWRNYFEKTDALVYVVDSADTARLAICRGELHNLLTQEKLAGSSLLVFANKQDLPGALSVEEIYKFLNLGTLARSRHCVVQSCSAVTGEGLADGMDWVVSDVASRIYFA